MNNIKNKNKLNNYIRILMWIIAIVVLLFILLVSIALLYSSYKNNEKKHFQALSPIEQRVEIYESFWKTINDKFYDKNFNGIDWAARHKIGLEKAKIAKDKFELWSILNAETDIIGGSHLSVEFPDKTEIKTVNKVEQKQNLQNIPAPQNDKNYDPNGMGFEIASIRFGNKPLAIIGEVEPNSIASKLGLLPGWILDNSVAYPVSGSRIHYKGEFYPISGDNLVLKENNAEKSNIKTEKRKIEFDFNIDAPTKHFDINENFRNIMYIRFDDFENLKNINSIIKLIKDNPNKSIIFDLRKNTGGHDYLLKYFIANFLGSNVNIGYALKEKNISNLHSGIAFNKFSNKIAVLIGPQTASAAEIFSNEIKVHKRGIIIGRRSEGSVLMSKKIILKGGIEISVPIKSYLSSDKKSAIEGIGVKPDIEIMPTTQDLIAGHDVALERAIIELQK